MLLDELVPGRIADLRGALCRGDDVAKQQRGEDPVADRRLAPAAPPAPGDGDRRFAADDPSIVPRWNVEDIPGTDIDLCAVVHADP